MKFTLNWLKEYLDTTASLEQISETLTAIGLEVEDIVDMSADLAAFQIAQIKETEPHPNADKLRVCKVDTGSEELQIVCGAPNARAGINVVLAPVGSVIPTNGMKIKASEIRGVKSNGMLCSAAELGLGDDHAGIIEMPACNDNIAQKYSHVAGLDDPVIEIAITPNRGDCLGVYGIARDLAAAGLGKLKPLDKVETKGEFDSPVGVKIEDSKACPLFVGRYFRNVKNGPSPEWMQNKLRAIGLNPISALVDITNYIAYAFGRPLHVYDADKIGKELVVRLAKDQEEFLALDDKKYSLEPDMAVVADKDSVHALGGVIGGVDSGCSKNTKNVFLEVALFDPVMVSKTGRLLDIITDSRYRFERNVDPHFVMHATEIVTKMLLDICGGTASDIVIAGQDPNWQHCIEYDFMFTQKRSGIKISENDSKKILESLGFKVKGNKVEVPSWRMDVVDKVDIVEEIVRIYGYDKIPLSPLPAQGGTFEGILSPAQKRVFNTRHQLAARGMVETVTWSFLKQQTASLFGAGNDSLKLMNPINKDLEFMRPSLLPNLIEASGRNNDRGYVNLAFFEIGLAFKDVSLEGQNMVAAGIRSGMTSVKNQYNTSRNVDALDAKADCLAALEAAGAPVKNLRTIAGGPSWYHPGRSGVLCLGKTQLAVFGEVHPLILKALDVRGPVVAFEMFFDKIPDAKKKKSAAKSKLRVSEYQNSVRDFAFVVEEDLPSEELLRVVRAVEKQLIVDVSLFDIYKGKGVEEGKKSLAISVCIQADDRTLTEEELDSISSKVVEAVAKIGGTLR